MARSSAGERGALTVFKAITWVVYALATAAIIILAFGFVLALMGASANSAFSAFIYEWSDVFLGPFKGMVAPTKTGTGVVSWNALIAIAAYAVMAWLVGMVLDWVSGRLAVARSSRGGGVVAASSPATAAPPARPVAPAPAQPPADAAAAQPPQRPEPSPEPQVTPDAEDAQPSPSATVAAPDEPSAER